MSTQYVVVRSTESGETLWESPTNGKPLIEYVPAEAFRRADAGLVSIKFEERES